MFIIIGVVVITIGILVLDLGALDLGALEQGEEHLPLARAEHGHVGVIVDLGAREQLRKLGTQRRAQDVALLGVRLHLLCHDDENELA